jgi:hypothetical protein
VGAVVDEIPHHEGLLGELLVVEQAAGVLRQLELGDLGRRGHDPAEARGLAVGEDRTPREGRHLTHRDALGEEHGGVGVVAGREVDEPHGHEQLVGVVARLQLVDELGPDDLDEHGLDEAAGRAVLGVHGEHHEVTQAVDAVELRLERLQGVEEVGHPETGVGPALEIDRHRLEVRCVVRQHLAEAQHLPRDGRDVLARRLVVGGLGDAAVLHLQQLQGGCRVLDGLPGGVLHDLGFSDDGLRRGGLGHRGVGHGEPPIRVSECLGHVVGARMRRLRRA